MQPSLASVSKTEIRTHFRAQRRKLSEAEQLKASRNLLIQCRKLEVFNSAKSVALYIANDGELDPQMLVEDCWKSGKSVYLPVLHPFAKGHLAFFKYTESTPMQNNRFGIAEPKLDVTTISRASDLDLVFTPLVAFDSNGHRLGMGGGFYDRTLASLRGSNNTQLIGLAHECQQASRLSSESWDIPVSKIVTPSQIFNTI